MYQFFIRATDSGTPPRQSDVPIELFVLSPEDLPPVFLQEDQKFNLTESAPIGMFYTSSCMFLTYCLLMYTFN